MWVFVMLCVCFHLCISINLLGIFCCFSISQIHGEIVRKKLGFEQCHIALHGTHST